MKEGYKDILEGNRTSHDWLSTVEQNNKITADNYRNHLRKFARFVKEVYSVNLDAIVERIIKNQQNAPSNQDTSLLPHNVLARFISWINTNYKIVPNHKRMLIVSAKRFLAWNDVEISESKMRAKVRVPKIVKKKKKPLNPETIREILLGADGDLRLKTYVHFLASTGCRATEALSLRMCDLDLVSIPPRANIRGEFTKTKVDRYVFLTKEVVHALNVWFEFKYRRRRTIRKEGGGRMVSDYATPDRKNGDLVFAQAHFVDMDVKPERLYGQFERKFGALLDRLQLGDLEENGERRKFTLHSLRRFVKTTIADAGHSEYSEWFIGHEGSTYYTSADGEKIKIFGKIEPYLTFLDYNRLEAIGADVQSKIDERDRVIEEMKRKHESDLQQMQRSIENKMDEKIAHYVLKNLVTSNGGISDEIKGKVIDQLIKDGKIRDVEK